MGPPNPILAPSPGRRRARARGGYSLIETALATIIVGVGVVALMQLFASCTKQNQLGANMTTALLLAQNVQEAMADLPFRDPRGTGFGREETGTGADAHKDFNDVDDFHDWTSAPGAPIDATRERLAGLAGYAQAVSVERINPNQLSSVLPGDDAVRVTVRITYRSPGSAAAGTPPEVYRVSWVRVRD